jgi:intein/homing endonuclease
MSWNPTHNNIRPTEDVNAKFALLEGDLEDEQAKATLAEFLNHNPALALDLLGGIKIFPMQEVILKGWARNDYNLAVYGRGVSKTLAYNQSSQLLSREHGLISLPSLLPNVDFSKEGWVSIDPIMLWNGNGWQRTDKIYVQPNKDCLRVKTRDGYALEGSTNHLIKVWNPEKCEVEWKRYGEIKIGDYACISRSVAEWGSHATEEQLREAYLVGLLLGDGCYSQRQYGVRICSADEEILSFVEAFPHCQRIPKKGSKATDLRLKGEFAEPFLERWGLKRSLSYGKFIPDPILKNKALARECLSGLFDTDGTANRVGGVQFSTVSEHMARQVQCLLLTFGIMSTLRQYKTPSSFGKVFNVGILGVDQVVFHGEIGFKLKRKTAILESNLDKTRNTNLDIIPGAKELINSIKRANKFSPSQNKEWHDKIEKRSNQHALTYTSFQRALDFLKKNGGRAEDIQKMEGIISERFFFSPIQSIEPFAHDCLDFNVPTGEMYWTNGFISHNSFMAGLFALWWTMFNPNCRVVVISYTFRQSRAILDYCTKFIKDKDATLLRRVFPTDVIRGTDEYKLDVPNGSTIRCLPLGDGSKIRGVRADVLIVDEFAFLPESIIGEILRPFLASNSRIKEQLTLRAREDELIAQGLMNEDQRIILDDRKKVIFLSSACYQFEHMYRRYTDWIDLLTKPTRFEEMKGTGMSYFVSRLSCEAAPEGLLNAKEIEEARKELSEQMFNKEYRALFIGDSEGYFRAVKLRSCSIDDGESPCLELIGERGARYVLGIDPSLSGSETSDDFAMCLQKIVKRPSDGKEIGMVVHNYAVAGGNMKDHVQYLWYLLKSFNIVAIAIDASQGDEMEFINTCNQSKLFKNSNMELMDIECDFNKDNFSEMPAQIRKSYNHTIGRIVMKQSFHSAFQKAANEYLQGCLDHKGILFAAKIASNNAAATRAVGISLESLGIDQHEEFKEMTPSQFIDNQDYLLDLTKKECTLIQVKVSDLGTVSFGLPASLKKTTGPNRVRKDSYSALLVCNWCTKLFTESQNLQIAPPAAQDFPYAMM